MGQQPAAQGASTPLVAESEFPALYSAADRNSLDGQRRFLNAIRLRLAMLVLAAAFGLGVERLVPALPPRWGRAAAAGLVAAPVLLLPALAWGAAGRLAAVPYPEELAQARTAMAADPVP